MKPENKSTKKYHPYKKYLDIDVHQAAMQRIKFIFDNFDNIYVSLSGGKDSGVMLNLVLDYMRENHITRKIGVLFIDLEAFYKRTIDFIDRIITQNLDLIEPYWLCLPMLSWNTVSMYEPFWKFWDPEKEDVWVRPLPKHDFIITKDNNPFEFWYKDMTFEDFITYFGSWYSRKHGGGKTACLVGIRTDESLNRWRSIMRQDKGTFEGHCFSTQVDDLTYNFYPIYDWRVNDIWTYNGKYHKDYNHIYDLMYKAGIPLSKQRVCEPFGDEQKAGLNMYKVLEPETWFKVVGRVGGANFGNIYANTKAIGRRKIDLPKGHTWKSYTKFLLATLPKRTRDIYVAHFITFIKWWHRKGSPISNEEIAKLPQDIIVNTKKFSKRGKGDKYVVRFKQIPDTLIDKDDRYIDARYDAPTWKRMCMAIIKNDINCKTLSFGLRKHQIEARKRTLQIYNNL